MQYSFLAIAVSVLAICYTTYLIVDRLWLSPVARFPGSRLAALTFWYEFYYDVILGGQYTKEIQRMHETYGPIVRINPRELHINDPEFYDTLYCLGKRVNKWDWEKQGFPGMDRATFGTADHDLHQARRTPLAVLFSKRATLQLEPLIRDYIEKLISRLENLRTSEKAINLFHVFSALTGDIIFDYSFGTSQGLLETPDFAPEWHLLWVGANAFSPLLKQLGNVESLLERLPEWLALKFNPVQMIKIQRHLGKQLSIVKEENESGTKSAQRTVFHEIFDSNLPPEEKSVRRLMADAVSVMAAGTVTTADTLAVIAYHIVSKPSIRSRLEEELFASSKAKTRQTLSDLEQLPYLTAIIKEGLRVSYGVASRLPRIFPDDAIEFNEWMIPPGTPISMSCLLMHDNPDIFPDPKTFNPDRWLNQSSDVVGRRLDRYLVPFSKGTRQCLGINLAYAEMYMTIATVFAPGKFAFQLFGTTDADVEVVADNFIAAYRKESKGVRVTVQ